MAILMAIGRVLFSLIFILAGIGKVLSWSGTEQYFINSILDMLSHTQEHPWIQSLFDSLLPHSSILLMIATAIELLGGLLIFFGLQVRLGALILFLFLIPTTLLFHSFWLIEGSMRELQMAMFMKNISIMGGCLILIACGSRSSAKGKGE